MKFKQLMKNTCGDINEMGVARGATGLKVSVHRELCSSSFPSFRRVQKAFNTTTLHGADPVLAVRPRSPLGWLTCARTGKAEIHRDTGLAYPNDIFTFNGI